MPSHQHQIEFGEVYRRGEHKVERWDLRYLRLLDDEFVGVKSWSKDPKTHVAAGLVNPHNRLVVTGYNGFPAGIEDSPDRLALNDIRHGLTAHAERNVLDLAPDTYLYGYTMYCTYVPCLPCVVSMASKKITRFVAIDPQFDLLVYEPSDWRHKWTWGLELFREAGIEYTFYTHDEVWTSLEKSVSSEEPADDIPF